MVIDPTLLVDAIPSIPPRAIIPKINEKHERLLATPSNF
jgi:hypothetical protein